MGEVKEEKEEMKEGNARGVLKEMGEKLGQYQNQLRDMNNQKNYYKNQYGNLKVDYDKYKDSYIKRELEQQKQNASILNRLFDVFGIEYQEEDDNQNKLKKLFGQIKSNREQIDKFQSEQIDRQQYQKL